MNLRETDPVTLRRLLLSLKTTRNRFSLPMAVDDVARSLETAFRFEVEYRHMSYRSVEAQGGYIRQAAEWLTSGDKFGLFLAGSCGNGKTTLMKAIQSLINALRCRDDNGESLYVVMTTSKEVLRLYRENMAAYRRLREKPMLAIDDFGAESVEVMDYGNVVSPVTDLLDCRYDGQMFTMLSSNLNRKDIRNNYGDRLADRFNEMMKVIVFENPSMRV